MNKRFIAITALILVSGLALSGCFGGMYGPQPTPPPQKIFSSEKEFADAVAKAKTDLSAEDLENLKGLTSYYVLQTVPEGAVVMRIKASSITVIVEYASGPVSEDTFDNQIQVGWLRDTDINNYMNHATTAMSNTGETYKSVSSGGIDYLVSTPVYNTIVTPSPGDTTAATPTPRSSTPCQVVQWVQDGAAFIAVVPIGFTDDDIGKYCRALKTDLVQ